MEFEPGSPLWIMLASAGAIMLGNYVKHHLARTRKPTPPDWEHPVQKVLFRRRKPADPQKLLRDMRGEHTLLSRDASTSQRPAEQPESSS